ncbi:hypothetical protein K488DRAFT_84242 [Vararia minispora EC-137]|uniref:Uncharacterized protein n=1 Tax=Vararia minispora EC-137 TaxID=1314806 RepID=A0ACB8QQZ1_9AGAM|nr:hypothetical protein K488DRAFT_84242 [Vararia minispora EC-137]
MAVKNGNYDAAALAFQRQAGLAALLQTGSTDSVGSLPHNTLLGTPACSNSGPDTEADDMFDDGGYDHWNDVFAGDPSMCSQPSSSSGVGCPSVPTGATLGDIVVLRPAMFDASHSTSLAGDMDCTSLDASMEMSGRPRVSLRRRAAVRRKLRHRGDDYDNLDIDACLLLLYPDVARTPEASRLSKPRPDPWQQASSAELLGACGEAARSRRRRFA